jgi:hypothetical protein
MKVETAINRILKSDDSVALKISKLQTLALRCFASSPNQKTVIAAYQALQVTK